MTTDELREHYTKLLLQLPNHGELAVQRYNPYSDQIPSTPSEALYYAFNWWMTPEDWQFWNAEYESCNPASRVAALRESARAKLTPEEAEACGL